MNVEALIERLFADRQVVLDVDIIPRPLEPEEDRYPVDWDALKSGDLPGLTLDELGPYLGSGPEGVPERVTESIGDDGVFDTCAWYQPIHFFGYDWGIFVREECLVTIGQTIACWLPAQYPRHMLLGRDLMLGAFFLLFLHEHFHHKVECLGIRLWVVEKAGRYSAYKKAVYRPTWLTDANLEEALANADSYRRLSTAPYSRLLPLEIREATRQAAEWLFRRSAPGYRKATDYLTQAAYSDGITQLQAQVQEATLTPTQTASNWEFAPRMMQSFLGVSQRIWTVVPKGVRCRLPLVHAPPVRTPSSRQIERFLRSRGFVQKPGGGKGSHSKFTKAGAPNVVLPSSRERVSPGVARTIARALGVGGLKELNSMLE